MPDVLGDDGRRAPVATRSPAGREPGRRAARASKAAIFFSAALRFATSSAMRSGSCSRGVLRLPVSCETIARSAARSRNASRPTSDSTRRLVEPTRRLADEVDHADLGARRRRGFLRTARATTGRRCRRCARCRRTSRRTAPSRRAPWPRRAAARGSSPRGCHGWRCSRSPRSRCASRARAPGSSEKSRRR